MSVCNQCDGLIMSSPLAYQYSGPVCNCPVPRWRNEPQLQPHDLVRFTRQLERELSESRAQVEELKKDAERLRWCYEKSIKPLIDVGVRMDQILSFDKWIVAIDAAKEEK